MEYANEAAEGKDREKNQRGEWMRGFIYGSVHTVVLAD